MGTLHSVLREQFDLLHVKPGLFVSGEGLEAP